MARPLRIEYPGALYHVTARGNRRDDIFINDGDRESWLDLFTQICKRFNWLCHGYCLMTNHYHLIVETVDGNLSLGMRQLNGVYTQYFNRVHDSVGHLFQGRYKSILVDRDGYLLELSRYIVLNPVRAGMVHDADDWPWSSYRAIIGKTLSPEWLPVDMLLSFFHADRELAQVRYREYVQAGVGCRSPMENISNQIFLGDEDFVTAQLARHKITGDSNEVPKAHRCADKKPLSYFSEHSNTTKEAMAAAYLSGHYTMKEVGKFFGVHYATVSRAVKCIEALNGVRSCKDAHVRPCKT